MATVITVGNTVIMEGKYRYGRRYKANQTDVLKALSTKREAVGRGLLAAQLSSTDATVRALLHKSHIRLVIGKEGVAVTAIG